MKKPVILLLLAVILIGSLSSLVLYNIGGYVLDSAMEIVRSAPAETAELPPRPAPGPAVPGRAEPDPSPNSSNFPEVPAKSDSDAGSAAGTDPAAQSMPPKETQRQPEKETEPPEPPEEEGAHDSALLYSPEEVSEIKESITPTDKISASLLVLSKLSAEDIQYLYSLLEGGLTSEEKAAAKNLCYARFSQDEIEQIYQLYIKYKD